ncbi:hypothetical protein LBW59_11800 [Ralstonia solanacearum]|uniref:Uncharacterized protein n=1 Tax=Ralstonia solanacearum TaxID=305 RepID=A0AAW5ZPS4_RALSL|nr:hypothetical protein [Ralstonia solanacearum]MDB0571453.1 hypothetical protein [Ralstonia solanacearum]
MSHHAQATVASVVPSFRLSTEQLEQARKLREAASEMDAAFDSLSGILYMIELAESCYGDPKQFHEQLMYALRGCQQIATAKRDESTGWLIREFLDSVIREHEADEAAAESTERAGRRAA